MSSSVNITNDVYDEKNVCVLNGSNSKIDEIISKINKTMIEKFFYELMSFGPRMTSTHGCKIAADYIYDNFLDFNLEAKKHQWCDFGNRWNPGFYRSENIIGTHKGLHKNAETIVFNAHYDTVKDSVGANDDGSGVVGVLAAAYVLSQYNFNKTIKFVAVSGEEIGLLGSTHYAKYLYEKGEDILVEFNADMIGRSVTREDGRNIRLSYSEDTTWIIDMMKHINASYDDFDLSISGMYPYNRDAARGYSDYWGFITHGYESISVWEQAGDPYANTPDDVITNVNTSYLVNTTRIIAATIASLADVEDQPPKVTISAPKKGKIYYEDRIIRSLKDYKTIVLNDIWIYTDIKTYSSNIDKVEFYYDGNLEYTKEEIPYVWHLNKRSLGRHKITVKIYDDMGRNSTDMVNIFFLNLLKNK